MMTPYEAARALGIKLYGHLMCCPHPNHNDERPSCLIRPSNRKWVCFACGARGDAVDLAIFVGGMTPRDAREWARFERDSAPVVETLPTVPPDVDAWCRSIPRAAPAPTPAMVAWCKSRGLWAGGARMAGWRDCRLPVAEAPAALGYRREDGRLLWALDRPGVWVPAYLPGYPLPLLWRRRLYQPITIAEKDKKPRVIKIIAPSSDFATWCWGVSGSQVRDDTIHIVEGEPDWLAYRQLHPGQRILARFGSTRFRRETWQMLGGGAGTVVVATHQNRGTERLMVDIRELGAAVVDRTVPESRDWADRAKEAKDGTRD